MAFGRPRRLLFPSWHPHLDHVKWILFLADNVMGTIKKPVNIRALPAGISAIRIHLMYGLIWPDFTSIPTPRHPVLAYRPFRAGNAISVNGLKVKPIPMNHPVPAVGFLVSDGTSSILYSADTGPNELLWTEARRAKNLKAIIVDTSFSDAMGSLADISGHFTPRQLHNDLAQAGIGSAVPIYIYHIKPSHKARVIRDLGRMGRKNVKILREGKTYLF